MARHAEKPMYQVYHFRADRQTAELLERYREVLASKFSARAIYYFISHFFCYFVFFIKPCFQFFFYFL